MENIHILGINQIDQVGGMSSGEGYQVVLSGSDSQDLVYGESMMTRTSDLIDNQYNETISQVYSDLLNPTGLSYPIIITDIIGEVSIGDEIVAYANNQIVGATRIADIGSAIAISAWQGFDQYGISLDGFTPGDEIVLKLYSDSQNKEVSVDMNLDQINYGDGVYAVGTIEILNGSANPNSYILGAAYPNPFNPTTNINFSVNENSYISVIVYDLQGREVAIIHDDFIQSGDYTKVWDATNEPSGIYLIQMSADGFNASQKVVLIK